MTEYKRIINWNAGMQNDFHYLATDNSTGMWLIYNFVESDKEDYPSLSMYYHSLNNEDETQFAQDLIDLYTGKARFPEQKYILETTTPKSTVRTYIKDIFGTTYGGIGVADEIKTTSNKEEATVLSQKDIIQKLGEKYMAFAIPVDEVND